MDKSNVKKEEVKKVVRRTRVTPKKEEVKKPKLETVGICLNEDGKPTKYVEGYVHNDTVITVEGVTYSLV